MEIYSTAPYTDFDIQSKIEKPTAVLATYAKTRELQPGDSETLTLYIGKEALASYCYTRDNGDDATGAYVLEEGEYLISLRSDSHNFIDICSFMVEKTIWYDSSRSLL